METDTFTSYLKTKGKKIIYTVEVVTFMLSVTY